MDAASKLAQSQRTGVKVARVYQKRVQTAQEQFQKRVSQIAQESGTLSPAQALVPLDPSSGYRYAVDCDAALDPVLGHAAPARQQLRRAHATQGLQPVLHFDYEIVLDGRKLRAPGQLRAAAHHAARGRDGRCRSGGPTSSSIRAPATAPASAASRTIRRSAWRCAPGHPVYFVIFFRDPEPGQTLLDVCEAEQQFVQQGARAAPDSAKPAIIGNCQGGWAAMMLAAVRSRRHRPDRHQRRADVVLGRRLAAKARATTRCAMPAACSAARGSPRSSADLGNGKFDGAHLVQNFENLNPANSLLGQVLPPLRQRRHRAAALPRVRALVGRLLPDEPRRDRVDHAQPVRRQQAVVGRRQAATAARRSTCATSSRRSSCSRRWATTSRRRSRRSTGWPTSTAAPTRSRRAAR